MVICSLLLSFGAAVGATAYECRDASGKTRFTNKPCGVGETAVEVPLRHNDPWPVADPPPKLPPEPPRPVIQNVKGGAPMRYAGSELTVEAAAFVETRGADGKWTRLRPVRAESKAALRRAVEAFNAVPGLSLRLSYAEASDPEASLGKEPAQKGRFIAFWADVPPKVEKKYPYSIGCFPYFKQADGRILVWCDQHRRSGESIGGAFFQLREYSAAEYPNETCKQDTEVTFALRYLGESLGLAHTKDRSSIMGGACGPQYLAADRAALQTLYGRGRP